MSKRREKRQQEGEELLSTYNNMQAEDGSLKRYCPECGLPRDVEYAKVNPCVACGAFGTQKRPPLFDELGERIPDEVIAERNAAKVERLKQANAARRAAKAGPTLDSFLEEEGILEEATSAAKQRVEDVQTAVSTADMFLMMW